MAITFDVGIIGRLNFGIVSGIMDTFDISNKQKKFFAWVNLFNISTAIIFKLTSVAF